MPMAAPISFRPILIERLRSAMLEKRSEKLKTWSFPRYFSTRCFMAGWIRTSIRALSFRRSFVFVRLYVIYSPFISVALYRSAEFIPIRQNERMKQSRARSRRHWYPRTVSPEYGMWNMARICCAVSARLVLSWFVVGYALLYSDYVVVFVVIIFFCFCEEADDGCGV